jgi:hypothetical protein
MSYEWSLHWSGPGGLDRGTGCISTGGRSEVESQAFTIRISQQVSTIRPGAELGCGLAGSCELLLPNPWESVPKSGLAAAEGHGG